MLVSTMVLIPPYRTKILRCYRKAMWNERICGLGLGDEQPGAWGCRGQVADTTVDHLRQQHHVPDRSVPDQLMV